MMTKLVISPMNAEMVLATRNRITSGFLKRVRIAELTIAADACGTDLGRIPPVWHGLGIADISAVRVLFWNGTNPPNCSPEVGLNAFGGFLKFKVQLK